MRLKFLLWDDLTGLHDFSHLIDWYHLYSISHLSDSGKTKNDLLDVLRLEGLAENDARINLAVEHI